MRRLPRTFWLLLTAGVLLGIGGLIDETPTTRALFMLASIAMLLSAFLTLVRTSRQRQQRERDRDAGR